MLHIVNKSHDQSRCLHSCLRFASPGQALLLTEDAVYAATEAGAGASGVAEAALRLNIFALRPDLEARGMAAKLAEGVTAIDYAGFVDLVAEHPTSQTWL
jgi:tRNA 2-thiouridine synthesizing protein B